MEPYAVIKFVHVLAAIVAVGFNASYATWLARAAPEPQHLGHVLATIGVVDNVANAFYALLLVTGLGMVLVGSIPLTTFWIAAALVLYVLAIFVGIVLFAPVARGQREALAKSGPRDADRMRARRLAQVNFASDVL